MPPDAVSLFQIDPVESADTSLFICETRNYSDVTVARQEFLVRLASYSLMKMDFSCCAKKDGEKCMFKRGLNNCICAKIPLSAIFIHPYAK